MGIRLPGVLSSITGKSLLIYKTPIVAIVGLVAIASGLLFIFRAPFLSTDRALLGLAIIWTGLAPGLYHLSQPSEVRTPTPLMPLTGAYYSVFFGLAVFFSEVVRISENPKKTEIHVYHQFLDEISLEALVLTFVGTTLMFVSWWASKRFLWRKIPHIRLPKQVAASRLQFLYWGLAGASLAYVVVPWFRTLPSIGQFLQPATYLAFSGFYVLWKRGKLPGLQAAAYFLCLLPIWVAYMVQGGLLTPLILMFVIWVALYFQLCARLPWRAIAGCCLVILIIYPLSSHYRLALSETQAETSIAETPAIIFRNIKKVYTDHHFNLFGLTLRVSHILIHSVVVEQTPNPVPYWGGETYKPLLTSWIPRALWPEKPEEKTGNAFGHRYALISPNQLYMSVNLPWITEMYANFGRVGVIAGMFLVGLMFGALEKILNEPGMSSHEWVIGVAVLIPLAFQESNFTVMTGSVLPLVICLWLYFSVGLRLRAPRCLNHFGKG